MSPSQITFMLVYVEAPQHVEYVGSFHSLTDAKDRASLHFADRHRTPGLRWHNDAWGGSRARHLNSEYLVRELEWVSDPLTPDEIFASSSQVVKARESA